MKTIEQVLDTFDELSSTEKDIVTDLLVKRRIEASRNEIALQAEESLKEYHDGDYKAKTANECIDELREYSNKD
ncbi:MAG: hypothetical protein ABSG15_09860 [FCB group bacterium]|jgi:hypothetical protein